MDELAALREKVSLQDRRIAKLEKAISIKESFDDYEEEKTVVEPKKSVSKSRGLDVSFNQVITVLGILGISIGAVSFFFYAIARGWIGETAQVLIGVLAGFVLFFVAYSVREKNAEWSNIVFGGAYFIEYLSIGVGISIYKVMPPIVGIIFGALLLVSSMALSFKFSSRMIAYFSLIGGFVIPIITDTFESQIFVMVWYLLLLIALSWLSISFDWVDLRMVMLVLISTFMFVSFGGGFRSGYNQMTTNLFFLAAYFVLFNVSSMINSVLHDNELNLLDSLILGVLPIIFLPLAYIVMNSPSTKFFGLIIVLFSFVYLIEGVYLKSKKLKSLNSVYALVAAGVAALNIGVYFLLREVVGFEFFIIFFIIEWALFSYMSYAQKSNFYRGIMFVFLALIGIWFVYVLRFDDGIGHATFFLIALLSVPLISLVYFRKGVNFKINSATFIISGYLFLFSFFKYLAFFIESLPFREIILSVLWLFYTLVLFVQAETSSGKILVGILLGITLLKIAFRDLLFLTGAFRIVGFILFGVLLLVGGYFLEHAKK